MVNYPHLQISICMSGHPSISVSLFPLSLCFDERWGSTCNKHLAQNLGIWLLTLFLTAELKDVWYGQLHLAHMLSTLDRKVGTSGRANGKQSMSGRKSVLLCLALRGLMTGVGSPRKMWAVWIVVVGLILSWWLYFGTSTFFVCFCCFSHPPSLSHLSCFS